MSDSGRFIRTALGDVAPEAFGACSAHEHVIIDDPGVAERFPDFDLSDVGAAAQELTQFKAAGGGAVVETMPAGCGRNAVKSAEASRRSGVHVVLATGVHLAKYYRKDHWLLDASERVLTEGFVADIEDGIPETDDHPDAPRTALRAGVIKVAGGRNRLDGFQQKIFRAAAAAQQCTGCPIITHTEQGTAAPEQLAVLVGAGAHPARVVLSHVDRVPDAAYHRALLEAGAILEYDGAFRWGDRVPNPTVELIAALAPEFPDQIVVGMDLARRTYKAALGGAPGLAWLMTGLRPMLAGRGIDPVQIDNLYTHNPARAFAFGAVRAVPGAATGAEA